MIDIFVAEDYSEHVDTSLLENAAIQTLKHQGRLEELELSIVVDADERIQELNRQFIGVDAPTDVLSFPADEFDPDTGLVYLGDMILSFPTAKVQAEAAGVPVMDELQLLVVHAMLHLLGHDHADAKGKAAMWAAQSEVLNLLGVNITRLPE